MVKGLSRRVIVVDSPDPHIFEQAIFIVRNDAAVGSGGVTSQQVVDQVKVTARRMALGGNRRPVRVAQGSQGKRAMKRATRRLEAACWKWPK